MRRERGLHIRVSALAGAALILCVSGAAAAQTSEPAQAAPEAGQSGGLEDIVVTAEKRETNLQDTPIAISVLGGEALRDRHVQSLEDLMDGSVPSLRVAPFFSRSSALTVGIRGIVPFDANQPSRDAGVGVYIDGVYLGRSQGLGAALYDLDRIEVLKGPQGTLFGRNSTGGAVSLVTAKPSGKLKLRQTFGLSNYNGYNVVTHLDLPEFANISLKFDGILTKRDGTVDNPLRNQLDFNSFDKRGLHAAALWQPSDNFDAQLDFDISYDATSSYYVQLLDLNPAGYPQAPLVQVQPDRADTADIGVPEDPSVGKTHGLALHLEWRPGDVTIRSISSYRHLSQSQFDNGSGAHSGVFTPNGKFSRYSLASLRQHQWSQEIQLLGSFPQLEYVAGLYYYHEYGDDDAWTPNTMQWNADGTAATPLPTLEAGASTPFPDRASTARADSLAAFGQATFSPEALGDIVHLTVGARYTHDTKSGSLYKVNGADTDYRFHFKSDRVDPAVTLAVDAADDVHLYGKWGTAYRAGGANSRSLTYRAFGPEKVSTFEIGAKTDFLDRHARLNLAAYVTRYSDIQIDFNANIDPNSNRGTIETVNDPGHGTIKGIEADLSVNPVKGLTLSASYAYTQGSLPPVVNPFTKDNPATPADESKIPAPVYIVYTPDHAYSASADYATPVSFGTLRFHIDANGGNGYHAMSGEDTRTDKSFVVNGRVAIGDIALTNGAELDLSVWSRNLFNEAHTFVESRAAYAIQGTFGIFNEPRTWGVDATLKF